MEYRVFQNSLVAISLVEKKKKSDIPIETFYKYLKNLNEEMQDENDEDDILFWMTYENPVYGMILNGSITKWNDRCNTK